VSQVGPGGVFGAASAANGLPRRAAAVCWGEPGGGGCVVWRLSREAFHSLGLERLPPAALASVGEQRLLHRAVAGHFLLARAPERAAVAGEFHRVEVAAGEHVFRQGDAADTLYVVAEGAIEAATAGRGGRAGRVASHRRGEVFGDLATIFGGPRGFSAWATEPTVLWALPRGSSALRADVGWASLRRVFDSHASVEQNGERFMTREDVQATTSPPLPSPPLPSLLAPVGGGGGGG
jgi:hypothetical protein